MTTDYPLLALPSYELYQLAHIATFIADALARHSIAARGVDRDNANRDIAAGRVALGRAGGDTATAEIPRPVDAATYQKARELVGHGRREAEVVSLASTGRRGWAVVGQVPGIGPVGGVVATEAVATALRHHLLTQPAAELSAWAVTERPLRIPKLPRTVDLAALVENLDPRQLRARAVARHLRGIDRRTDAAVRGRFAGVDLDEPLLVAPPGDARPTRAPTRPPTVVRAATAGRETPGTGSAVVASRHICGVGVQETAGRAAKAPTTSAGP